jgi:hypothetical protein
MALPDLAADTDLSARGVTIDDAGLADVMLAVASALVREAAGSPILEHDATVNFHALDSGPWLDIPVAAVQSVASVELDGTAITDYQLVNGRLWRAVGWNGWEPVAVEVTLTCGLPAVPADIVQLVCDLAILGMDTATAGAIDPRVVAERIDDYSVTFTQSAASVASAMTLPTATRLSLRARFGGGVGLVALR